MFDPHAPTSFPPPGPAPYSAEREVHLLDRLSVLYRYRRVVVTVFLLVVVAMMLQTYTATPVYKAHARLVIEDERTASKEFGEADRPSQNPDTYYQTQYRILRGRELARVVVRALELDRLPEFNRHAEEAGAVRTALGALQARVAAVLASIGGGSRLEPPAPDETAAESAIIDAFLAHVDVEPVRNSRLVDLYFRSADPALAARAANALAEAYIQQDLDVRLQSTGKTLAWLSEELATQQRKVEDSERALAQYREEQNALSLAERQNIVVSRLNQINDAVTRAKTTRVQKEALYAQLRELESAGAAPETFPAILQNPFIQEQKSQLAALEREKLRLSERYGEKHPEIVKVNAAMEDAQRRLRSEIQKVIESVRNEYRSAMAEERTLTAALEEQKGAAMDLDRKSVTYTVLEREARSNRQIHEALLQRANELRVAGNSRANNVRLMDRAETPQKPFSPDPRRNLFIALVLGLTFGVAAAVAIDYLDDTIKTPDDVTGKLRLPFLGLVPAVHGNRSPLLTGPAPQDFGEAFRALRTSLVFSNSVHRRRIIAVTSAQPLEGKTTTACNLALALAAGGARVLLVDADMRRPGLHKVLGVRNDTGLSHLLVGRARAREAIQRTHIANLWVLPAGRTPPNPSELLSSARMRSLLESLPNGPFDWVIIDTPPVLAVTDAVILTPAVSGVVLVMGAEMTRRRIAERAVETMMTSGPRILGVVLNRVDVDRNRYYYARFYGYQYKSYYGHAAQTA
jgi:succinoglycan biosynthesis transport protein ExoP